MTAWILVALAITAALIALAAALLLRPALALTALAATAGCFAAAFASLHQAWAVVLFTGYAIGFLLLAGAVAVRRKLPPYAVGDDDQPEGD